jgi:hypothetical protein
VLLFSLSFLPFENPDPPGALKICSPVLLVGGIAASAATAAATVGGPVGVSEAALLSAATVYID